ncbi:MAG: tetratricopeptide repeat protein [candidate division KSB1 bacterium]|nr:tetratricopeptide repeat protein [candidate division KSB1 bacterium]MDZ7367953.1 tetratricopeptide repeat protein [candidate division KSB1 bacterium]MDZ7405576.1 tetratricopeptide repeat protein [candidate division KSB1 bacterium]
MPKKQTFVQHAGKHRQRASRAVLVFYSALGAMLLGGGIWASKSFWMDSASSHLLPKPNLLHVEPLVARKIQALRREVEKNPQAAAAWGKLGMSFDVHDFKSEAAFCYRQAATLDPTELRWLYYCALVLNELGDPEALNWFARSRLLQPNYAPLHINYAHALFNAGRFEESAAAFRQALKVDPKSSHALLGLARIALAQGDLPASERYALQAVAMKAKHQEARGLLAEVYRRLNRPEKAANELLIAQRLPPVTPLADSLHEEVIAEGVSFLRYRERGFAYLSKNQIEKAVGEFQMALQLRPNPQAYLYVGDLLRQIKKYDQALVHYRRAIELQPDSPVALVSLTAALYEVGQTEEAFAGIENALLLYPAFPAAYLNLATFHVRSGRPGEAIASLRRGLRYTPDDLQMTMHLAWLLATASQAAARNGAEALRLATIVCEKTGYQIPETLDVLAAAQAEAGRFNQAVATARRAQGMAVAAEQLDLAGQLQARLKLYESKLPYRE